MLSTYADSLKKVNGLYVTMGLTMNDGLHWEFIEGGRNMEAAFKAGAESDVFVVKLLQMRRQEKNYIIRGGGKYVTRVDNGAAELEEMVESLYTPEEGRGQIVALQGYLNSFHRYVEERITTIQEAAGRNLRDVRDALSHVDTASGEASESVGVFEHLQSFSQEVAVRIEGIASATSGIGSWARRAISSSTRFAMTAASPPATTGAILRGSPWLSRASSTWPRSGASWKRALPSTRGRPSRPRTNRLTSLWIDPRLSSVGLCPASYAPHPCGAFFGAAHGAKKGTRTMPGPPRGEPVAFCYLAASRAALSQPSHVALFLAIHSSA